MGSPQRGTVHARDDRHRVRHQGGLHRPGARSADRRRPGRRHRRHGFDLVRAAPATPTDAPDRRPTVPQPGVLRSGIRQPAVGAGPVWSGVLPVAILSARARLRTAQGGPGGAACRGDRHRVRRARRRGRALRLTPLGAHHRLGAGRSRDGIAGGVADTVHAPHAVPAARGRAVRRRCRSRSRLHRRQRHHPDQRAQRAGRLGGRGLRNRLRTGDGAGHRNAGLDRHRRLPHRRDRTEHPN